MLRTTLPFLLALGLTNPCANAADGGALLTTPGKVLYENTLATTPSAPWQIAKGTWTSVEGVLRGSEKAEDNHPAVFRMMGPVASADLVVEYEFRFVEGGKLTSFSINGPKGHICRVSMTPTTFTVQKDDSDHAGPDKGIIFSRQAGDFKSSSTWHKVRLEIVGKTMLGKCDDLVGWGEADLIASPKANIGFTVSGQSVELRNLKVSEATANPAWAEVKEKLPKGKPVEPAAPKKKKATAN